MIASITLFLLWLAEGEHQLGNWRFVLPPFLLFLSFMMFSRFRYPSFKAVNWKTKKSIPRFLAIISLCSFSRVELRMDAGGPVSRLFALRSPAAMAVPRMASAKSKKKSAKNHRNRPSKRGDVDHTIAEVDNLTGLIAPEFPGREHPPIRP